MGKKRNGGGGRRTSLSYTQFRIQRTKWTNTHSPSEAVSRFRLCTLNGASLSYVCESPEARVGDFASIDWARLKRIGD